MATPDVLAWRSKQPNGRIPLNQLAVIEPLQFDLDLGGPARMYPPAAAAMSSLLAEAREDGYGINVKYSYRTLAVQWVKWRNFLNGGNLAARPGTSNHGLGLSVDLTNISESDIGWLRRHAMQFGYINDVPSEVWHWTYQGGYDPGRDEDMNLDKYVDGESLYRKRYKERLRAGKPNADPGEPPPERDRWFKAGWNAARFGANNPRR